MASWMSCKLASFTRIMIICIGIISYTSVPSMSAEVSLAWDANDPPVDGYLLFIRAANYSYDYASPVWSGVDTTCTIENLSNGTYYFVVRAYSGDAESQDSNEVEVNVSEATENGSTDDCDIDGLDLADFINGSSEMELDALSATFGSMACP
jgi:hypothetical protein